MRTGVLLLNLGTPASPEVAAVKAYLAEFLMDPYVIDIPWPLRWLLVCGIILRTRPRRSAAAYQSIWTEQGSPLLINSQALADALASALPANHQVCLGMRYGSPSIESAVEQLRDCQRLVILPLFPQYSLAATRSAINAAQKALEKINYRGEQIIITDFYADSGFIESSKVMIEPYLARSDFLLLSFHGLPVKQLYKVSDCRAYCDHSEACPVIKEGNRDCYRAQCYASAQAITASLKLSSEHYAVSFQSRLGALPWIKPYTDHILPPLYSQGVRSLAVACPSFVADCLETFEEIGLRLKSQWQALGGESFHLIPCLNSEVHWVQAVAALVVKNS